MNPSPTGEAARLSDLLRSLLFYPAFYGITVGMALFIPLVLVLPRGATLRWCSWWAAGQRWCMRWIMGVKVVVEGPMPTRPVLVAMKHESFFEAIDLPVLFRFPVVFAKVELLRLPLWGKAGLRYGLIPVERDQGARALRAMVAAARASVGEGRHLVIFPEGTRVPHGGPAPLQAGFAGLYKLIGLPVVPVAVNSGPLYHRWIKRSGTLIYRFGAEIPPGLPRDEVEARVQAAINALNG
ncbi:MAG TPA: lysophospholipid acyltransferase family protein [Novosphingobium sp.]|nr:lysophospholipid acyltransferase family protein [Novosphingobium sp.]HZV09506.1 lysophospholipid acyltransferase family protein [Novosphingobium sp.]